MPRVTRIQRRIAEMVASESARPNNVGNVSDPILCAPFAA